MTLANMGTGDIVQPKSGVSVSKHLTAPRLPIVRVVQDQSQNGETPGAFYHEDTGQESPMLQGTPLAIQQGRTLWPKPFKVGEPPRCWSRDGAYAGRGAEFAGKPCGECPFLFNGCNLTWAVVFRLLPEGRISRT